MQRVKFLSLALAALMVAAFSAFAAQDAEKTGALVMEKCTSCHGPEVICSLLGKRDADGWDWIVSEMQRGGAKLKLAEKRDIVDYLAELPAGSAPVCKAPEKPAPKISDEKDPEALVMRVCTACHDTRRICSGLKKKGKDAWDKTVTMMMFNGAQIDVEQKLIIVDYLFKLPSGAKPVCE